MKPFESDQRPMESYLSVNSIAPISSSTDNTSFKKMKNKQDKLSDSEQSMFGTVQIDQPSKRSDSAVEDAPSMSKSASLEQKATKPTVLEGTLMALVPTEAPPQSSVQLLEDAYKLPAAARGAAASGGELGPALGIGGILGVGLSANLLLFYGTNENKNHRQQNERAEHTPIPKTSRF
ncbi:hypothetical protein BH10CYA1_BH10CYA1_64370 [soil metagenome]